MTDARSIGDVARPRPRDGESLAGFVARAIAAEGWPNTLVATAEAGIDLPHRADPGLLPEEGVRALARTLGQPEAELLPMAQVRVGERRRRLHGVAVDERHLVRNARRFAPSTLRAEPDPHHRALWGLHCLPFCAEAGELLERRCPRPACGAVQRWYHALGIGNCDVCAEPLGDAPSRPIPDGLLPDLRLLVGLLHHDPARRATSRSALPTSLEGLDPGDLLDLACALAGFHDHTVRERSRKCAISVSADPAAVTAAMAAAWRLLVGWPGSVEELVGRRLSDRAGRHGDNQGGTLLHLLRSGTNPSLPASVRNAIGQLDATFRDPSRGIDATLAQRLAGVRMTEMTELRRSGVVPSIAFVENRRVKPLLDANAVSAVVDALRASMPLSSAACALGTTHRGAEQLVHLGRLGRETHPAVDVLNRAPRVTRASVEALADELAAAASVDSAPAGRGPSPDGWPRLREVMHAVPGIKPWGAVLAAVADRRFRTAAGPDGATDADGLRVHPDDAAGLVRFAAAFPDDPAWSYEPMMSKRDASDALSLDQRFQRGLLSAWPSDRGPEGRTVPVEAVMDMSRLGISVAEFRTRLGLGAVEAGILLRRAGVPIVLPGLFDREAVHAAFALHPAGAERASRRSVAVPEPRRRHRPDRSGDRRPRMNRGERTGRSAERRTRPGRDTASAPISRTFSGTNHATEKNS